MTDARSSPRRGRRAYTRKRRFLSRPDFTDAKHIGERDRLQKLSILIDDLALALKVHLALQDLRAEQRPDAGICCGFGRRQIREVRSLFVEGNLIADRNGSWSRLCVSCPRGHRKYRPTPTYA